LFSSATDLTVVPLRSTQLRRKKNETFCHRRGGIKSETQRYQKSCAKNGLQKQMYLEHNL